MPPTTAPVNTPMPHPRPTVSASSSSLWRPIAHPTPPPTSAPPVAPTAVYSLCSGVHDAHDETVKSTTVANAPTQFFHLYTRNPSLGCKAIPQRTSRILPFLLCQVY